jgi:hypothetical protein
MQATELLPARFPADHACESDQGDWGGICPLCGQRLPPRPGPLQSWHAGRAIDGVRSAQARAASHQGLLRPWHL